MSVLKSIEEVEKIQEIKDNQNNMNLILDFYKEFQEESLKIDGDKLFLKVMKDIEEISSENFKFDYENHEDDEDNGDRYIILQLDRTQLMRQYSGKFDLISVIIKIPVDIVFYNKDKMIKNNQDVLSLTYKFENNNFINMEQKLLSSGTIKIDNEKDNTFSHRVLKIKNNL